MARKKVEIRPRPSGQEDSDAEVDRWVGAEGVGPRRARRAVKMGRLTLDIPADLRKDFKLECTRRDTTMVEEVIKFIERYVHRSREQEP